MTASGRTSFRLLRALAGAISGAVLAIALTLVLSLGFILCRWPITGATEFDRSHDLQDARERMPSPVIGCAALGAGAGWLTFISAGKRRFAHAFAIVFLASLPLWFAASCLDVTPVRYKGVNHPAIYLSEALVILGPPLIATAIATGVGFRKNGGEHRGADLGSISGDEQSKDANR